MDSAIRLMIVDDEYLVRELLKNCMNWREIGYEIVGEAENAKEALALIDSLQPDVVVTDIRMPGTDGLDLSVQIKSQYPEMKVLILSGYGEFKYAKRAIEAGVDNYLLKPINDEELTQVFVKLRKKIIGEREERSKRQKAASLERDSLLHRLILGQLNVNELSRVEREWFPERGAYLALVVETDRRSSADFSGMALDHWRKLPERLGPGTYALQDAPHRIVVLTNDDQWDPIAHFQEQPGKEYIAAGIGNRKKRIAELGDSCREARVALRYAIVSGPGVAIPYDGRKTAVRTLPDVEFSRAELEYAIEFGKKELVMKQLEAALLSIDLDREDALQALQMEAAKLDMLIRGKTEPAAESHRSITELKTLDEILRYLEQSVDRSIRVSDSRTKKVSQTVREVQRYLENHYGNAELSLTQAAETFYLNPSYLSRVFKEETGVTFVEYLTRIRMERALHLLRHTDKKIYEIASEVGFKDPHYFSQAFKKAFGRAANEYRKKNDD
jgi:two-component system response regulator YesN